MNKDNRVALIALVDARLHRMKLDQPYMAGLFDLEKLVRKAYAILEAEQENPAEHIENATEVAEKAVRRAINFEIYQALRQSKDSPLYAWLREYLLSGLRQISNNPNCEDAVQEGLQSIFENLDGIINPESFLNWALQIVRNANLKYYRKATTNAKIKERLVCQYEPEISDPSQSFFYRELREILLHHINSLRATKNTGTQKCILLKFYFEDRFIDELAAELKISNQRVSHLLDEAHGRLRNDAQLMKKLLDWINENAV